MVPRVQYRTYLYQFCLEKLSKGLESCVMDQELSGFRIRITIWTFWYIIYCTVYAIFTTKMVPRGQHHTYRYQFCLEKLRKLCCGSGTICGLGSGTIFPYPTFLIYNFLYSFYAIFTSTMVGNVVKNSTLITGTYRYRYQFCLEKLSQA